MSAHPSGCDYEAVPKPWLCFEFPLCAAGRAYGLGFHVNSRSKGAAMNEQETTQTQTEGEQPAAEPAAGAEGAAAPSAQGDGDPGDETQAAE